MFRKILKKARLTKKMSVKELAQKAKISISYLSKLENNVTSNPPSHGVIIRLAETLDLEFEFLYQVFLPIL